MEEIHGAVNIKAPVEVVQVALKGLLGYKGIETPESYSRLEIAYPDYAARRECYPISDRNNRAAYDTDICNISDFLRICDTARSTGVCCVRSFRRKARKESTQDVPAQTRQVYRHCEGSFE